MRSLKWKSFAWGALQAFKVLQKIAESLEQASNKVWLVFTKLFWQGAEEEKKSQEEGRIVVDITLQPSFAAMCPTRLTCMTYINH